MREPVVVDLVDLAGVLLFLAALLLAVFLIRQRMVRRSGATLTCALRCGPVLGTRTARGWHVGMARYTPGHLQWYRVLSFSLQPRLVLVRRTIRAIGRREPHSAELVAIPREAVIVSCTATTRRGREVDLEIAMSEAALTGFLAWMESSPPGVHHYYDGGSSRR